MPKVGLIGNPVSHSVSPAMHNAAFAHLNLDEAWHYELYQTAPENLEARVDSLRSDEFGGANITIPYKQDIADFLDNVVLSARSINAVNTIVREDDQLIGHNTDVAGFILDLETNGIKAHGMHALVLGSGGAAHAAVLGLANRGAHVTVLNRHEQKAWDLRNNVRRGVSANLNVNVQAFSALPKVAPDVDLIVNCTPVGMHPNQDDSIWDNDVPFPADAIVYDMVYRPAKTKLMQQAESQGLKAINGLGMLVQQGALAFELWTNETAPVDIMMSAAQNALDTSK